MSFEDEINAILNGIGEEEEKNPKKKKTKKKQEEVIEDAVVEREDEPEEEVEDEEEEKNPKKKSKKKKDVVVEPEEEEEEEEEDAPDTDTEAFAVVKKVEISLPTAGKPIGFSGSKSILLESLFGGSLTTWIKVEQRDPKHIGEFYRKDGEKTVYFKKGTKFYPVFVHAYSGKFPVYKNGEKTGEYKEENRITVFLIDGKTDIVYTHKFAGYFGIKSAKKVVEALMSGKISWVEADLDKYTSKSGEEFYISSLKPTSDIKAPAKDRLMYAKNTIEQHMNAFYAQHPDNFVDTSISGDDE